ncbi:MAG: Lrp/AsnC family transcriptional regulator [Acidimicrobiales bacterium]|nr:Lrp/AsnC family transcriptional regulator [Acidimicrobiales bacterium]MCB1261184.1 Lrp/AsnC family transcriptional regulator [Acidimicrobiales bacterium]
MAADPTVLDDIDREILRVLERDGRIGWQQLGPKVGLSPNAAAERVKRLERRGVIERFTVQVDPVALGRNLEALVFVKMVPDVDREPFETFVAQHEAVDDAVHLTGMHDYVLRVHCFHAGELDDLLMGMKRDLKVADSETRIILRRVD